MPENHACLPIILLRVCEGLPLCAEDARLWAAFLGANASPEQVLATITASVKVSNGLSVMSEQHSLVLQRAIFEALLPCHTPVPAAVASRAAAKLPATAQIQQQHCSTAAERSALLSSITYIQSQELVCAAPPCSPPLRRRRRSPPASDPVPSPRPVYPAYTPYGHTVQTKPAPSCSQHPATAEAVRRRLRSITLDSALAQKQQQGQQQRQGGGLRAWTEGLLLCRQLQRVVPTAAAAGDDEDCY